MRQRGLAKKQKSKVAVSEAIFKLNDLVRSLLWYTPAIFEVTESAASATFISGKPVVS